MKTPTQIVWEAAGSPAVDRCEAVDGRCYLCAGHAARGISIKKWVGGGFNDHARVGCPASGIVCEACAYVTARTSPVPGRPPGKCAVCRGTLAVVARPKAGKGSKSRVGDPCPKCNGTGMNDNGASFRNVSSLWEDGVGYVTATKGEKPLIRDFLRRAHIGVWFCAIAEHEKHVLPFARLNGPGHSGTIVFADDRIVVPESLQLVDDMTELLTAGASKSEVETCSYGAHAWRACEPQIRAFEERWTAERGTGWFGLALWLAQRDEDVVQRRVAAEKEAKRAKGRKAGKSRNCDAIGGPKQGVHANPGAPRDEALEPVPVSLSGEPAQGYDDRPVAREDPKSATDHHAEQLRLFGV